MLQREFVKPHNGVLVKSGHVYVFNYSAWQNDKRPTVLMMYAVSGIHPKTKHEHRYFQGINFTYIPRSQRVAFAKLWVDYYNRKITDPNNVSPSILKDFFTWEKVKRFYPMLEPGIRRYFYKPAYYITNMVEVQPKDMKKAIESTWAKDFSTKVRNVFARRLKKIFG